MSRFVMPVDTLHVTYAGDVSVYRSRRMTRAQLEAVQVAQDAARVQTGDDRAHALETLAVDVLSRHVYEVQGVSGDQYPTDLDGRAEWWREMRTAVERYAVFGKLQSAVTGDPSLLSFGRAPGEGQSGA